LGASFSFCLQEPKISSPSICVILTVQTKPKEYFKIIYANCFESLDWVAHMVDHPTWNENIM
jgi:hypothetical protein